MSWHASDEHKDNGKLRHPADGQQWKDFNENHKDFAKEPRNVRFALSTDGINPFAERSSKHSTWPVILTIYNLPPWLMQKRKYILLTILIFGPTQSRVDMDVFLEPLMEDMEILWETGVRKQPSVMLSHFHWPLAQAVLENASENGYTPSCIVCLCTSVSALWMVGLV
jgi:hypothetical protein